MAKEMMLGQPGYDEEIIKNSGIEQLRESDIERLLADYEGNYDDSVLNESQRQYFGIYLRGLLSNLDRKSIEPIALAFMGAKGVRGLQQYLKRNLWLDEALKARYQELLAETVNGENGMLSVDGSDFEKKGAHSAGVARQYCGRLGKTENCQAGVFVGYASGNGYGLADSRLYIPESWFGDDYAERRKMCGISEDMTFRTKNEIALDMIRKTMSAGTFQVRWIGCDAAFGRDHKFREGLPDHVWYFAGVNADDLIFRAMPEMHIPISKATGRPYKHPRPSFGPVTVQSVAADDEIPWRKITLAQGAKGPIFADVKWLRCVDCHSTTKYGNYSAPGSEVWLYIRRYADGTVKYALSNAPSDLPADELHRAATLRWPIEQCFQECKGFLGMGHYESRSWIGWHRHMLMVMIAHLFILTLRISFKKRPSPDFAHGV